MTGTGPTRATPAGPSVPRPQARHGLSFRIMAGLVVLAGIGLTASFVAILSFERFRAGYERIARVQFPAALSAAELGREGQAIATQVAAAVPRLQEARTPEQRIAAMEGITPQIRRLDGLLEALDRPPFDTAAVATLRQEAERIAGALGRLDSAVERRIALDAETAPLLQDILDAQNTVLGIEAESANPTLRRWAALAGSAYGRLLGALSESDRERLADIALAALRERRAAETVAASLTVADQGSIQVPASLLARLTDESRGIVATRLQLLDLPGEIDAAAAEHRRQTASFIAEVTRLIDGVRGDVTRQEAELEALAAEGSGTMAGLAGLGVIAAIAVVLYVRRGIVTRIVALSQAMAAHEAGGAVAIPAEGKDEIAAMGRAARHFVETIRDREDQLRAAKDAAEAASEAKSLFLAAMSHEIRTPMNGVMSMAELLRQTELSAEQQGMARIIAESASTLLGIINDILDFSKIEAGRMDLEQVPVAVPDLVDGVAALLAQKAAEKGLALLVDVDPELPRKVEGDPTRLRQILLNLAGNAVKFTETGHVLISVAVEEGGPAPGLLRFEVTDTGIGLSAEAQARLFRPFEQADSSTTRRFGGTGLGLAICRRLVDLMGGAIGVRSQPGKGSCFWFTIPLKTLEPGDAKAVADLAGRTVAVLHPLPLARTLMARSLAAAGASLQLGAGPADIRAEDDVEVLVCDLASLPPAGSQALPPPPPGVGHAILLAAPDQVIALSAAAKAQGWAQTLTRPIATSELIARIATLLGLESRLQFAPGSADGLIDFEAPGEAAAAAAGACLLVADDNPTNRVVVGKLLDRLGYVHAIVDDGEAAWQLLGTSGRRFGLLLTDCHMPRLDGYDLTRRVRGAERNGARAGRLPVIALTADAMIGVAEKCSEAGMDGYVTKPIDIAALDALIMRHLPAAAGLRRPRRQTRGRRPVVSMDAVGSDLVGAQSGGSAKGLAVLDRGAIRMAFGDLGPGARDMLEIFLTSSWELAKRLEAALAAGDMEVGQEAAHGLKGGASFAGAQALAELAREVDDALRAGALEAARQRAAGIRPALAAVEREIGSL